MNETNLYAPPRADVGNVAEEEGEADELVSASQMQRIVHSFVDGPAALAFLSVLMLGRVAVFGTSAAPLFVEFFWTIFGEVLFYTFFEAAFQRTPGKWLTNTRVVSLSGTTPTLGQIVVRSLVRLVPFEFVSYLARGPGWHDKWSRTRVVKL